MSNNLHVLYLNGFIWIRCRDRVLEGRSLTQHSMSAEADGDTLMGSAAAILLAAVEGGSGVEMPEDPPPPPAFPTDAVIGGTSNALFEVNEHMTEAEKQAAGKASKAVSVGRHTTVRLSRPGRRGMHGWEGKWCLPACWQTPDGAHDIMTWGRWLGRHEPEPDPNAHFSTALLTSLGH